MTDLPPGVRSFLRDHIFSASQLEVLLLVRDGPPATLAEVARRTALPQSSLGPWLEAFAARGLLARDGETYRAADLEPALAAQVAEVADTWRKRKTTMTRYIYASSQDPLIRFADAFRLRRSDPGEEQEP